jgi:hypothetical protein
MEGYQTRGIHPGQAQTLSTHLEGYPETVGILMAHWMSSVSSVVKELKDDSTQKQ